MKERSKSLLVVLAGLMLIGSLSSCGDDGTTVAVDADATTADTASAADSTTTIAVQDDAAEVVSSGLTYPIVDTNLGTCYDNSELIDCPAEGEAFYGQDAQYTGNAPSYTDSGDGTVTDNVTGLIWMQDLSDSAMACRTRRAIAKPS